MKNTMDFFNYHLTNNSRTEKPIVHISLNPHPKDNLEEEELIKIAEEYVQKLGFGKLYYPKIG